VHVFVLGWAAAEVRRGHDMSGTGEAVKVLFFANMKDLFGRREAQVDCATPPTVGRLLSHLCSTRETRETIFAESGKLRPGVIVLVNGRSIAFLGGLEAPLSGEDEVNIFPPLKGG
jgi:sulfur-carrier protein